MRIGFIGLGTMGASMASNSNEGMDEIDGILVARGRAGSGRCCD